MSSEKKGKSALAEFETNSKEIRQQLVEQLKCFDSRVETKMLLLADFQEFFKKIGELELEYARNTEKVCERFMDKLQRMRVQRKERMTSIDIWKKLLMDLKHRSHLRVTLADVLNNNVANRCWVMSEDVQRTSKWCRDTTATLQDELNKSLQDLQKKMRKYHSHQTDSKAAESKLRQFEKSTPKSEDSPKRVGSVRKTKFDKQKEKHRQKYSDHRALCLKARNDYLLALEATNTVIQKYYDSDLSDLMSMYDHNYHTSLTHAFDAYSTAEIHISAMTRHCMESLGDLVKQIDPALDKQAFFEDNNSAFNGPEKFQFVSHVDDEVQQICSEEQIQEGLDGYHRHLFEKLKQVNAETEEIQKTLSSTLSSISENYSQWDVEVNTVLLNELIAANKSDQAVVPSSTSAASLRASKEEMENYYFSKFKELILTNSVSTRIRSQYNLLNRSLGDLFSDVSGRRPIQLPPQALKDIKAQSERGKMFGCKLEDHYRLTGQEIPEIVESCVKFITKFGLEHQGIFRLSGASQEITEMKEAFESGRDPLAGLNHWKDINAVAGVMRLYFRELKDPLFPQSHYDQFIECSRMSDIDDQAKEITEILETIPASNKAVMKYLFKFLNLVSRNSEKNRMDSHNLAVVFGPTLFCIPSDGDIISNQANVNNMIEVMIERFPEIFTDAVEAVDVENKNRDSKDGRTYFDESADELSESEEELEPLEATALYNYSARSSKELSFNKGDIIFVYKRFNQDWWDGECHGDEGFVPDAYIKILSGSGNDSQRDSLAASATSDMFRKKEEEKRSSGAGKPSRRESGGHKSPDNELKGSSGVRSPSLKKKNSEDDKLKHRESPPAHHGVLSPQSSTEEADKVASVSTFGKTSTTPTNPSASTFRAGQPRPMISFDDIKRTQANLKHNSKTAEDAASSPKTESPPQLMKSVSLPRDVPSSTGKTGDDIWQRRPEQGSQEFGPESPPGAAKHPPAVKPKPRRQNNSSSELIAALQAGNIAKGMRGGPGMGSPTSSMSEEPEGSTKRGSCSDDNTVF